MEITDIRIRKWQRKEAEGVRTVTFDDCFWCTM
jgi:DNA-binding cell septation regulator SpoVG